MLSTFTLIPIKNVVLLRSSQQTLSLKACFFPQTSSFRTWLPECRQIPCFGMVTSATKVRWKFRPGNKCRGSGGSGLRSSLELGFDTIDFRKNLRVMLSWRQEDRATASLRSPLMRRVIIPFVSRPITHLGSATLTFDSTLISLLAQHDLTSSRTVHMYQSSLVNCAILTKNSKIFAGNNNISGNVRPITETWVKPQMPKLCGTA